MTKFILGIHHESGMVGRRLLKSIRERFPEIEQENFDDVAGLHRRLCFPTNGKEEEIVIVLVDNRERLERLIEMKGCLEGRRVVSVLHEENREILSRCHMLRPRYVSCEKDQFSDLLSVLAKMINVQCQRDSNEDNGEAGSPETNKRLQVSNI